MDHIARMLGAAALSTCLLAFPCLAQQSTSKHPTDRIHITKIDPNRAGSHLKSSSTPTETVTFGGRCSGFTRRYCELPGNRANRPTQRQAVTPAVSQGGATVDAPTAATAAGDISRTSLTRKKALRKNVSSSRRSASRLATQGPPNIGARSHTLKGRQKVTAGGTTHTSLTRGKGLVAHVSSDRPSVSRLAAQGSLAIGARGHTKTGRHKPAARGRSGYGGGSSGYGGGNRSSNRSAGKN